MLGYLKRYYSYLEAGVMIFNIKHEYALQYLEAMRNLYLSHDVYYLQQIHDAFIWEYLKQQFDKNYNIINYDLSKDICKNENVKGNCNVLEKTFLNKFMYHYKGPTRKSFLKEHYKNKESFSTMCKGRWSNNTGRIDKNLKKQKLSKKNPQNKNPQKTKTINLGSVNKKKKS